MQARAHCRRRPARSYRFLRLTAPGAIPAHRRRRPARSYRSLRVIALGATVVIGSATAVPAGGAAPAGLTAGARPVSAIELASLARTGTAAAAGPAATTSYYEHGADPAVLAAQGRAAGLAAAQGLVILDFGRPAVRGSVYGTVHFGGSFVSLAAIEAGVQAYVRAYFETAPRYTQLAVAVGTNNSCGTGQPCGPVVCGCRDEPPSFAAWGGQLGFSVRRLQSWATAFRARGFTDVVKVVAADDAEPAYDPGYHNTYAVLEGYARAVGGYQPAMVEYGSAEQGYWTQEQLFQVAYGFKPDLLVPQLYFSDDVANWMSLISYARARHGVSVSLSGVLTTAPFGNSPQSAYTQITDAVRPVTGQSRLAWTSNIAPLN